jgi:hypothetical protein
MRTIDDSGRRDPIILCPGSLDTRRPVGYRFAHPGGPTALYRYPYEDHGSVAKETLLDLWARRAARLDKYVKNPEKRTERRITMDQQDRR